MAQAVGHRGARRLSQRLGGAEVHELFDVVVGVSTGGILACLLAVKQAGLARAETTYDTLVGRVFDEKNFLRMALRKASYDEAGFEGVLAELCGDQVSRRARASAVRYPRPAPRATHTHTHIPSSVSTLRVRASLFRTSSTARRCPARARSRASRACSR